MRWLRLTALIGLVVALAGTVPAAQAAELCFPETGQCISGRIREYWEQNGGLPVFGLPLNAPNQELNRDTLEVYQTQWFERNRMELHPENAAPYDVLLGRLGAESLPADLPSSALAREAGPQAGCRWFEVTGHNVCNQQGALGFKSYWEAHGLRFDSDPAVRFDESLALFGYPLTQPTQYTNSSGDTVLTQWFERARFEWHPSEPDAFKVLLGRLGAEVYDPNTATGAVQYHSVSSPGWPYPLEVPLGFDIKEVASGMVGPRFMAFDPADHSLVVADNKANSIERLRDTNGDGVFDQRQRVADGFDVMHSVAFVNGALYAAEERHLWRLDDFGPDGRAQRKTNILDLPSGATDLYGHRTRTVAQGPDGLVYLSVGSSCDVCVESDPWRAALLRMPPDGSNVQVLASGLRNTVGFAWRPYTTELWGVDMGRNNIGADRPPDELNLIEAGKSYGWPYCYGDNQLNPEFSDPALCATPQRPALNLPPHWSPLGIVFYAQLGFPPAYQGDALVAFHGTGGEQVANQLNGYLVSRVRFSQGRPVGLQDLVRGWNQNNTIWGRPVGLLVDRDGSLLISDDFSGRVYRLSWTR